jgi:hypothetical protein
MPYIYPSEQNEKKDGGDAVDFSMLAAETLSSSG